MTFDQTVPSLGAALMDMAMLFATSGQEREVQVDALLDSAGPKTRRVKPLRSPDHLIEAVLA